VGLFLRCICLSLSPLASLSLYRMHVPLIVILKDPPVMGAEVFEGVEGAEDEEEDEEEEEGGFFGDMRATSTSPGEEGGECG